MSKTLQELNPGLTPSNLVIAAERLVARQALAAAQAADDMPIAGDVLFDENGDTRRIAFTWPEGWQLVAGGGGAFYLEGSGVGSCSGSLEPPRPYSELERNPDPAEWLTTFWIFSDDHKVVGNSVDVIIPVTVWRLAQ